MKEYIAQSGGRYTYADDILNLQELALSMSAVFAECTDFIISGCETESSRISEGYVWLGGKVRHFEGCTDAVYPYYISEHNFSESVVYANDVNKQGRISYLCIGSASPASAPDSVTGNPPRFIEITREYAPRLIDKFFGRYALLLQPPSGVQKVKKDVTFTGEVTVEKALKSHKEIIVQDTAGHSMSHRIREDGSSSVGTFLGGLLKAEILTCTDGSFSFVSDGTELARIGEDGFSCGSVSSTRAQAGSISICQNHLTNTLDDTDEGSVNINHTGLNGTTGRFRNLNVYDGKSCTVPLFQVHGKNKTVTANAQFRVCSDGTGYILKNNSFAKTDKQLTAVSEWQDREGETIASFGYLSDTTHDFTLRNALGNIVLSPAGFVNLESEVKINGTDIYSIFVTQKDFTGELAKKVTSVKGKGLSTEDFTTGLKEKLEAISDSTITGGGTGYVTAADVSEALKTKATLKSNLGDLPDKAAARLNLAVYSKGETDARYLKVSGKLLELVNLTADEINGMTPEQAAELKAQKQADIRVNLDAEKRGTGELKLAKKSNLSDLESIIQARKNLSVYSTSQVDDLLSQKLGTDGAYNGVVFTPAMKQKLDGIREGNFAYTDNEGNSHAQAEGYAMVSQVVKELAKKAGRLMEGYNSSDKDTIAANLGIYTKTGADGRFATVESLFQDYITFLVRQGKTTVQAQQILREKLDVLSKKEITDTYLRKDGKLSDLSLPNTDAKKLACRNLGAAYAADYQPLLADTGWKQMSNSGGGTDTRQLFIRQIGNIVSIQGVINTARRDGSNWGGTVAIIPNTIQPPRYGLRCSYEDYNDDHKYNRGSSFIIRGNSRNIQIYESGMYNVSTEINFTYFV